MPITFQEEGRIFHLSTAHTSYLFRVFQNDYLFTLYYGRRLRTCDMTHHWQVYPLSLIHISSLQYGSLHDRTDHI